MSLDDDIKSLEEKALAGQAITDEDIQIGFDGLSSDNSKASAAAALFLTGLDKAVLLKILDNFPNYRDILQKILIPLLAVAPHVEIYTALFDNLQHTHDPEMALILIAALAKTEYFILPILLYHLDNEDNRFVERLKKVLAAIGFQKIEAYLTMFPVIPHEKIFRQVYGDDSIDKVYG